MDNKTKIKHFSAIIKRPFNLLVPSKYIFVVSHMRSRSTVLTHILCSNDEIVGYREMGIDYMSSFATSKLRTKLNYEFEVNFSQKFLLDKVLHDRYQLNKKLMSRLDYKIIMLLRRPEPTIKSIFKMAEITGDKRQKNPDYVYNYYNDRLTTLSEIAKQYAHNTFFLPSEYLVEDGEKVLYQLSEWLNLKNPLTLEYTTFNNTGKGGYGDPSKNISSGVLQKTSNHNDLILDEKRLSSSQKIYDNVYNEITKITKLSHT